MINTIFNKFCNFPFVVKNIHDFNILCACYITINITWFTHQNLNVVQ